MTEQGKLRKRLTTKDLIISALKLCLLYRAKDRVIDTRFTRNTVPQPVQRIITLLLNPGRKGDGQACKKTKPNKFRRVI